MPVPIVPLALGAGLALWTLYEQQRSKAHAAVQTGPMPAPASAMPPVPLLPGAQAYLPPIAAPDAIRNAFANALYSKNPTALRSTAQSMQALGYGDLAKPLLATADSLEHLPAVRGDPFAVGEHVYPTVGGRHRRAYVGDDLELLVRTAGVDAWPGHPMAQRRAALLASARRRQALAHELDALAGVGAWPEHLAAPMTEARLQHALRRRVAGSEPPIYVGGPHYPHRRHIRRILRTV